MRVCLLLLSLSPLFAQVAISNRGVNFYSIEKERALGAELAGELRQRTTRISTRDIDAHLLRLGARLVAQIQDPLHQYTFSLIAEDTSGGLHEPHSLPGGYLFVPASLYLEARSEAELAGMLAHAVAHVAARHGTRQATRESLLSPVVPMVFLGSTRQLALDDSPVVALALLAFQRRFEKEADRVAVQVAAKAGYDPSALVRYIERVQPAAGSGAGGVRSAVPERESRIAGMWEVIQTMPARSYHAGMEFASIQTAVRRLVAR